MNYFFSFIFIFLLIANPFFAQNKKTDSLEAVIKANRKDTGMVLAYSNLCWTYLNKNEYEKAIGLGEKGLQLASQLKYKMGSLKCSKSIGNTYFLMSDFTKALSYYSSSLKIAEEIGSKTEMANCYGNIANVYYYRSDFNGALPYYLKQLKIVEAAQDQAGMGRCYNNIGNLYKYLDNFPKSLEYYLKRLKMAEKIKDEGGMASSYLNLGIIYVDMKRDDKAEEYYNRALKTFEKLEDKISTSQCYINLGNISLGKRKYQEALKLFEKSLSIAEPINDKIQISKNYTNIGLVYKYEKNYEKALEYYFKAVKLKEEIEDEYNSGLLYINIGWIYKAQGDINKGMEYFNNALQIAERIKSPDLLRAAYEHLAEGNAKRGNYKLAYLYCDKLKTLTDTIFNAENSKILSDLKTNFEVEKKESEVTAKAEIEKAKMETIRKNEKEKHQLIIIAVCIGLILVIIFAGLIFNRFKITQKQKVLIEIKEKETLKQKHIIEEKNQEITDSITYAKRLQQAILPPLTFIKQNLPESFILYKPKDIVAGDFYWCETVSGNGRGSDLILIAAADCTGHGVPGAMVSIVCSNALNRSVNEFGITETGKILDKTRELVMETFAKSESDVKDGMDISLLSISLSSIGGGNGEQVFTVTWSGANNPLWYVQNNILTEIRAHKQAIGKTDDPKPFPTQTVNLIKGDKIYLITDGYADQFGGPKGKKFKFKQLEELLVRISNEPMETQKNELNDAFENWRGDLEQVDDVSIIGIKL